MPRNKKTTIEKRGAILRFPEGFLWGAATSAYQVEGGIVNNDWAQSQMPLAGRACDHFNRFEEDFRLAKKLHHNAHRLSLEWSRIEPAEGLWNEDALDHYAHVLDGLKEKGFATFVTLHHFTNPVWFAKAGGWASRKSIDYFARFTDKIVNALGELIDFWVTVNEPNIYAYMCYQKGIWPPFQKSFYQSYRVYRNMRAAHNKAYDLIHAYYPDVNVGFANNIPANEPVAATSFFDNKLVQFSNWLTIDYPYSRTKNDFIGLNYYFRNKMHLGLDSRFPPAWTLSKRSRAGRGNDRKKILVSDIRTDKDWEIYPEGLYRILLNLKRFKKPIYILENGIADAKDTKRANFIIDHLRAVHQAMKKGAEVKGYFYWSLLDNYEWPVLPQEKTGYEMKFGLIEVDFAGDLKRKIRNSARVYAKFCKENALIV